MAQSFRKTLSKNDFALAGGVTASDTQSITSGDWNVIGEFTVPAQQRYAYGQGSPDRPSNQGYLYAELVDDATSPTEITGTVRLVQEDANGLKKFVVYEEQEEVLHGNKSDRQQKQALPEQVQYPLVGEDSRMKIEFDPSADATLNHGNSTIYIPVTVRTQG